MKDILVTYHKDCIDGTAAAAVVLRKFPNAKLFPLAHAYTQQDIEPILASLEPDTACYTVDCGLGVKEFLNAGHAVITLDHHIGGKESFEAIAQENRNYTYVFDNAKSGTSLAWSYFFPDEPQPDVVKYVEDADLWLWRYGKETKDVNNYISMFRNDPPAMLGLIEGDLSDIRSRGEVISMYADKEIAEQITLPAVDIKIGEYVVPAFNITSYQSASGNTLSEKLGKAVAMFTIRGDEVKCSFRSKDHHEPTSLELAQLLGGGGHKNAAGATIPLRQFFNLVEF